MLLIGEIVSIYYVMLDLTRDDLLVQISAAREASNIDVKVRMLQTLNNSLPKGIKLVLPSMFTNSYIRRALESLEDKVLKCRTQVGLEKPAIAA